MKGMMQFGLQYVYTWKCHDENPCIVILNKQKCLFFKSGGTGRKTVSVWGLVQMVRGEDIRKE
jgi:hypothetical protein